MNCKFKLANEKTIRLRPLTNRMQRHRKIPIYRSFFAWYLAIARCAYGPSLQWSVASFAAPHPTCVFALLSKVKLQGQTLLWGTPPNRKASISIWGTHLCLKWCVRTNEISPRQHEVDDQIPHLFAKPNHPSRSFPNIDACVHHAKSQWSHLPLLQNTVVPHKATKRPLLGSLTLQVHICLFIAGFCTSHGHNVDTDTCKCIYICIDRYKLCIYIYICVCVAIYI